MLISNGTKWDKRPSPCPINWFFYCIFAYSMIDDKKITAMNNSNEQVTRIRQMERRLVSASAAVKRLEAALDKYEAIQEAIAALDEYYGSDLWRQDLADDESGRLPEGLKRGVLSEDAIWNLLVDVRALNIRLQQFSTQLMGHL